MKANARHNTVLLLVNRVNLPAPLEHGHIGGFIGSFFECYTTFRFGGPVVHRSCDPTFRRRVI